MQAIRAATVVMGLAASVVASPVPAAAGPSAPDAPSDTSQGAAVVISEFSPRGPGGATDEFLELHNPSSQSISLGGWQLQGCQSQGTPILLAAFDGDREIAAGGHLLVAHVNSSGSLPDLVYDGWDSPDDGGWLVSDSGTGQSDGVGLGPEVACTEGDPASQCEWPAGEAVTRDAHGTDTDNNAADFTCQARTPGW